MKRLFLIAPVVLLAAACTQQPKIQEPQTLGVISLGLGSDSRIKTQATLISDESTLVFTRTGTATIDDVKRNTRYISATYTVVNNTGATLTNLTLYAINKTGNLGGTAIKDLVNFAGSGLTDVNYARGAQPTHKMNSSVGAAATIDENNKTLQLFTPAEATALVVPSSTVLEYGFRTNENSIASGATGTFALSYRLPIVSSNADATSFTATFAVAKDGPNRVSQSAEQNPYNVGGYGVSAAATEIAYFGPFVANANIPGNTGNLTKVLYPTINPKTAVGASPVYLFDNFDFATFHNGATFSGNQAQSDDFGGSYGYAGAACTVSTGAGSCNPVHSSPNTSPASITNGTGAGGNGGYQGVAVNTNSHRNVSGYTKLKIYVDYTAATGTGSFVKLKTPDEKVICFGLTAEPSAQTVTVDFSTAGAFNCANGAEVDTALATVLANLNTVVVQINGSLSATSLKMGTITFGL
jgi:hypothetical protein